MKTILVHNGASQKVAEVIKRRLQENSRRKENNHIICIDKVENIYKVREFLSCKNFTFLALTEKQVIDIQQQVDKIIVVVNESS